MIKQLPSIFNDVIGPVMIGPSSSHTAASVRIGRLVKQFFHSEIAYFHVDFEPKGSLAATYSSQASDIGLAGGILGMQTDDPRLTDSLQIARNKGIDIGFNVVDYRADHPNTYRIKAKSVSGEEAVFIFISTGGGMISLQEINSIPVDIAGDYFETLLFLPEADSATIDQVKEKAEKIIVDYDHCSFSLSDGKGVIVIKSASPLPDNEIYSLMRLQGIGNLIKLEPVLPVRAIKGPSVPFTSAEEVLDLAEKKGTELWELAQEYESARGGIPVEEVRKMGKDLLSVMKSSLAGGLSGTVYKDRILGAQAAGILKHGDKLLGGTLVKKVIASITAIMETKSSMGVIVAAPTAGSCGGMPGTILAAGEELDLDAETLLNSLLTAGLIGLLIAKRSTFAAEECGCQAECGSGSAMAAAALAYMAGGSAKQSLDAASMALQNIMGLVCDPVANRVEVPCLGKNVLAGMNAIASANMALAGFDAVIPLDQTIAAFDQAGRMIPPELRCTGRAGLSATPASRKIIKDLEQNR
jgi:L-serine dehydratase